MTRKKLLARLQGLLKGSLDRDQAQRLKKTLSALRGKQKKLERELEKEKGAHSRRRLKRKIALIREQRQKGQKALKELRQS